ncbi:MAG: ABC transporter permease [Fimbriimonadaceae bacterium]
MKPRGQELGIFVILVTLCAITGYINPHFLELANLQNTGQLIGIYGIFGIGLGIVIITGGIDLSVGSVLALLGVLLAILLVDRHVNPLLSVFIVVAAAALLGWGHGLLIAKLRMQPFIVTLSGLLIYRGLARYIADDETKGFGNAKGFEWLQRAATQSWHGVPIPVMILLAVAVIMFVVLHKSVYGRYLFAVGRNEEAARYAGINTKAVVASAYVICGALAGISTILLAFYTNSISPSSHGSFYELYGIAAAVLGGCSLRGGEGSILGIVLGTVLLQVLRNLVNLLHIKSSLEMTVIGVVILIGVSADTLLRKRR